MTIAATEPEQIEIVSDNPLTQAFYEEMRSRGESHNMAELLALRQFPGTMTDREFFEGQGTLADQFKGDEAMLNTIIERARSKGYNPNPNDVYVSALANDVGDPLAFVPPTGGRGHIQKVCEKRGTSCHGAVEVKGRQPENDPRETKKPKK